MNEVIEVGEVEAEAAVITESKSTDSAADAEENDADHNHKKLFPNDKAHFSEPLPRNNK